MEDSPINKTYRLTLDFTVWMNDEILHPYSDEDELDTEEKQQLQAQRSLLQALLDDKRGILEELIRKRVGVCLLLEQEIWNRNLAQKSHVSMVE